MQFNLLYKLYLVQLFKIDMLSVTGRLWLYLAAILLNLNYGLLLYTFAIEQFYDTVYYNTDIKCIS